MLNSLDIINKTPKDIRFDRTFSGADLARRQTLGGWGGGGNWGWGVDLTLRKNEKAKKMDSNGELATPL